MKILIAHHVESMWKETLNKKGVCIYELIEKIAHFCEENQVDKIVLTRFEDWDMEEIHYPFQKFNCQVKDYAYGWDMESTWNCNEETEWAEGGNHSEFVLIEDWMYDLKGNEVFLAGCFDGECIEDMEIALNHCEIEFKRVNSLII